ncbi:MAG: helix-turn-helix domain-containing protein [Chloroflexota bacterium]|nr:helix-turn-helix domain-containing protein [Chloroflexota bacterium]
MTDEQEWLTVEQVAKLLVVTEETIRRWIRAGEIPVLELPSRKAGYRIRKSDLDRFIAQRYGPLEKAAA